MKKVAVDGPFIQIDGVETQIRSGAMHYFRIPHALWHDRLIKLKQCGLNTVETYIPWNLHEPEKGRFDFTSPDLDFRAYLCEAQNLGLKVILRPGPYICSEWDFGGLPWWLLAERGIRFRCHNPVYLRAVERYFEKLIPLLIPLLWTHGGPVILVQVENEFGSATADSLYLRALYDMLTKHGVDVPFFVSDCDFSTAALLAGSLPETMLTVNCRNHPERYFPAIQALRPGSPEFVMELWNGAGHLWGGNWVTHDAEDVRRDVEELMRRKASFNLYMFHGGTTFGFMNGARLEHGHYFPHTTSYDTDAPLDEAGNPTPKYYAVQAAIRKFAPETFTGAPSVTQARAFGKIELCDRIGFYDALPSIGTPVDCVTPDYMEYFGQGYGWILYRFDASEMPDGIYNLSLDNLRDRAQVFVDGKPCGTMSRMDETPLPVQVHRGIIDILVENSGRINQQSGEFADWHKGFTAMRLNGHSMNGKWSVLRLSFDNPGTLAFQNGVCPSGPAFYRGYIDVDMPADTHLRIPAGTKGQVWLNGFNLGRYWNKGPQYSLYIPAPLLKTGRNEIVVFEQHKLREPTVEFLDHFDRGESIPLQ